MTIKFEKFSKEARKKGSINFLWKINQNDRHGFNCARRAVSRISYCATSRGQMRCIFFSAQRPLRWDRRRNIRGSIVSLARDTRCTQSLERGGVVPRLSTIIVPYRECEASTMCAIKSQHDNTPGVVDSTSSFPLPFYPLDQHVGACR